jgi:hypothetical protein
MSEIDLIDIAVNQGFAIAVCIWLLYRKAKEEGKTFLTLDRICNTLDRIEDRME